MHEDGDAEAVWSTVDRRSNIHGGHDLAPLSPVTISCQVEGCAWEMEDFLPTGNPILLHPLLAAYAAHHTIEAHPDVLKEILAGQADYTAQAMKDECRDVFNQFGINPADPYEHMELTFQ